MRGRARVVALIQVLLGLAMAASIIIFYLSSSLPMWEYRAPDGSYVIGWRTAVVFVLIVATTQWISSFVFREIKRSREKPRPRSME